MARPKAFDRDRALTRALELFQAKGYEATSIQDLVDAMGIGRQSLYDTFGDKEALYRETLERYIAEGRRSVLVALESPLPLRRAVCAVFEGVVAHLAAPDGRPCFIAHAALDRAKVDGWTAKCVQNGYQDYLGLWEHRFRRAQAEGDLGAHHDSRTLGLVFQSTIYGLQVSALAGVPRPDLEAAVRIILSILG
jgi:TetR/AcrR family transcriptional regulator, transcriptional repressor for nem operon